MNCFLYLLHICAFTPSLHHFLVPFFFRVCPSLCRLSLLQSGAMMAAITTLLEKGGIAAVRMVTWWAAPVWATAKENSNVNLVSADCRTHTRAGCRVWLMTREHVWCEWSDEVYVRIFLTCWVYSHASLISILLQMSRLAMTMEKCTRSGSSGRRSTREPSAPVLAMEDYRWERHL